MVSHTECSGKHPATDLPRNANDAAAVTAPEQVSRGRVADRRPHLRLEAGVAYLVEVGEGGACRCPFKVWCQKEVGRVSGTTAPPPTITRRTNSPIGVGICSPGWHVARSESHCESGRARLPAASTRRTPRAWVGDRGRSRLPDGDGPGVLLAGAVRRAEVLDRAFAVGQPLRRGVRCGRRSSASSSRCITTSMPIRSSRAWLAACQSGSVTALTSSAWASPCSSGSSAAGPPSSPPSPSSPVPPP